MERLKSRIKRIEAMFDRKRSTVEFPLKTFERSDAFTKLTEEGGVSPSTAAVQSGEISVSNFKPRVHNFKPGQIVKVNAVTARNKHVNFEQNVTVKEFYKEEEQYNSVEELEEACLKKELTRKAIEQIKLDTTVPLGKYEAIVERNLGDMLKPSSEISDIHEDMISLYASSSFISEDIDNLKQKEFEPSGISNNTQVISQKTDNSTWLKEWEIIEQTQSKILGGELTNQDKEAFEITFNAKLDEKPEALPEPFLAKTISEFFDKMELEDKNIGTNQQNPITSLSKSSLKKVTKSSMKIKKRVKFDASAIKSDSRLLSRYTKAKMQEHKEGIWLKRLSNMFEDKKIG